MRTIEIFVRLRALARDEWLTADERLACADGAQALMWATPSGAARDAINAANAYIKRHHGTGPILVQDVFGAEGVA